jgi:putative ABC transport system permease protein
VAATPPRAAEAILHWVLPHEDAEVIAGDLEETFHQAIVPRDGARAARLWYWRQSISIVWAHIRQPALEPADPGTQKRMTMPALRQDLTYAIRNLRKQPAFASTAVVMLALGIGANVAIFSLVNVLLLEPLPFGDPDRLMIVHMLTPERETPGVFRNSIWSYPKYRLFREGQRVFDSTSLVAARDVNLTGSGSPERLPIELVEFSYFDVLGVAPVLGRSFSADETRAPGSAPLAVLSHGFWTRRLGGDRNVVGQSIGLNGVPHTVLGVLPPGFRGFSGQAEAWVPVMTLPASDLEEAYSHSYRLLALRKASVSTAEAQAATRVLGAQVDARFKDNFGGSGWGAAAVPLDDERIDPLVRRSILLLLAAVACVLLIVCVNLGNLTLVRGLARQREVAIRLALGASRLRIVRQLMTENLLLSALGAIAGLGVAYGAVRAAAAVMPDLTMVLPRGHAAGLTRIGLGQLGLDGTTLLFTIVTATAATVLFGLGPAWSASRRDLSATIKSGSAGAVTSGVRGASLRNLLLVGEMALALVLLTAGGLMLKSVARLQATELGFSPGSVLSFRLSLPAPQYTPDRATQTIEQLLERLEKRREIESVAYGNCAPVSGGCNGTLATFPGQPPVQRGREPLVGVYWASPRYFEALGIRLVRGRVFTDRDRVGQPKVVVVNETAARTFWKGEDPIGKRIGVGQGGFGSGAEVVGVVADVRYGAVETSIKPDVYLPLLQSARSGGLIYVRSRSAVATLASMVRQEVAALDPDLPLTDIRMMEARFGDAIWRTRVSAWLLGVFSALALLLAALGIYSVMSEGVEQRRREIGVRMALGAAQTDIFRLIIGRVVAVALAGVALGVAFAVPAMGMLTALLYQVQPGDPTVFSALASVLLTVAVLAGYVPARRATRVDPLTTLRAE